MITPYVQINMNQVKENINSMTANLSQYHVAHRPHVKPHKSVELAKLQIASGAAGITCASLSELEVMAEGGIDNILLAFPLIGDDQWEKLYQILNRKEFHFVTLVDSEVGLKGLSQVGERLNRKVNVLVDIDSGGHREGIQPDKVLEFTQKLIEDEWLHFKGIFTYYGHIYQYEQSEHKEVTKAEANILIEQKRKLKDNGIEVEVLSGGSTVSSMNPEQLAGITESRAGNYIFYDMNAVHLGIIDVDKCALKVISKVVSTPIRGKATIDAGSKALSTDLPLKGDEHGYIINQPELKLKKLNEEHGFIEYDPEKVKVSVGDIVEIIPNHACVVPNLFNKVFLFENNKLMDSIIVDARGRNY